MPVTPSSARRSSNTRRIDRASPDVRASNTKSTTLDDSAYVQDRIRQWQAQGAADAPAPDALSARSIPLSDTEQDWTKPRSRGADVPFSAPPRKGARRLQKDEDQEVEQTRCSSTPRRRLFSDEHWKASRDVKIKSQSQTRQKRDKSTLEYDLSYTSSRRQDKLDGLNPRRPKGQTSHQEVGAADGGDRRQITPIESLLDHSLTEDLRTDVGQGNGSCNEDGLSRRFASPTFDLEDDKPIFEDFFVADEENGNVPKRSKYVETLGQYPIGNKSSQGTPPKSRRSGMFSKTKEIFTKTEPVPVMSNRLPSIEAWLEEQPDPLGDGVFEDNLLEAEVPAPLKPRSTRRKGGSGGVKAREANKISDLVDPETPPKPPAHSRRKSKEPTDKEFTAEAADTKYSRNSPLIETNNLEQADDSPTNLRRRGARSRRPNSSSPVKQDGDASQKENKDQNDFQISQSREPRRRNRRQQNGPSTGTHRLSPIASVETFKERIEPPAYDIIPLPESPTLKRKMTTHEDLMSVLSAPRHKRSTRSARSIRRARPQKDDVSAKDILADLAADEEKYARELRTLVDGVIPVLLQCVLSKSDSVAAAGLFNTSINASDDMGFTRPIIDMGIALERLRSLHGRMPMQNVDSLLTWAQTAQRAYTDYLKAWRLGFQDVVVNLAPMDEKRSEIDSGMARDGDGDVIDAEGKKADVAYLLKRPLVRVKNLGKTFNAIRDRSEKPLAVELAQVYADLTSMAKHRHQEEQARLEDEAAAKIDSTRSRDVRTMAAMAGVSIGKNYRVRARDYFNLTLYHSTGQRMDCKIEMIFRDNQFSSGSGGDLLICEVDESGKWLLFAPVQLDSVSARRGETGFDLVIMIRGRSGIASEWSELLALKTDDDRAATEWMNMIGSTPLPPKLNRTPSFGKDKALKDISNSYESTNDAQKSLLATQPSLADVDVPIGEPSLLGGQSKSRPNSEGARSLTDKPLPRLNLGGGLRAKPLPVYQQSSNISSRRTESSIHSSDRSTISDKSIREPPVFQPPSSKPPLPKRHSPSKLPSQIVQDLQTLKRDAEKHATASSTPAKSISTTEGIHHSKQANSGERQKGSSSHSRGFDIRDTEKASYHSPSETPSKPTRPQLNRVTSSTPSKDLPTVAKIRTGADRDRPDSSTPLTESIRDQWNSLSRDKETSAARHDRKRASRSRIYTEDIPVPPSHPTRHSLPPQIVSAESENPPPAPPHRDFSTLQKRSNSAPIAESDCKPTLHQEVSSKRRSSSPLKHEYAPSTASASTSQYDSESSDDSSSDTSDGLRSEDNDVATPLVAVTTGNRRTSKIMQQPPASIPSTGTRTLAPSDSASQGPYRQVPTSTTVPNNQKRRTIGLVCSWSDKGIWEQIHPDECSIVVSPGLIEAFEMSAAHSNINNQFSNLKLGDKTAGSRQVSQQPMVAFELTPIVPLRRGTALDISIRSPPTANSKLRTTNNIMFRSRNPEECETLYGMINWARCNNPTYIQLEKARPARQPTVTFNVGQPQHSGAKTNSWFNFGGSQRKSSYRASSAPSPALPSIAGDSDASVGTMNSAFSALKRFGANSAFNLNRSSVLKRHPSTRAGGSLYSSSTGTGTGSGSSTPAPSQVGLIPGKDGPNVPSTSAAAAEGGGMINNMKIRLYIRKGQHWENLGAGRLHVLPVPTVSPAAGSLGAPEDRTNPSVQHSGLSREVSGTGVVGRPGQTQGPRLASSTHTPHRIHGNGREKRIFITKNKEHDVVLLDVVLGESCFERVMQTGIAVKVWIEENEIATTGGVVMGSEKIYMMQFPGTREAGWVFGLCGTYRYNSE